MTRWPEPDPRAPGYGPPADPGGAYLPGPGFAAGPPGGWTGPGGVPAGPGAWSQDDPGEATAPYPLPAPQRRGAGRPARRRRGRRGPLLGAAAVLLAAAAAVTVLPHSGPAPRPAAAASSARQASRPAISRASGLAPAISRAAASRLLTRYVAANNAANRARSTGRLAQIEGGSSYQLDAGGYRFLAASDPAGTRYQAYGFTPAAFYIPRLAGYPRWFAVSGTWTGTRSGSYRGYLLFTQPGPGGRWLQVLAPNLTARAAAAPAPVTGAGGYAEAAPAGSGAGLAAVPGGLPAATAARLDGTAASMTVTGLQPLADQQDQAFWAARIPRGTGDTDRHAATPYGVYALRTAGGGALVFYSLAATVTITPPAGQPVALKIPGYYSPAAPVTAAAPVPYADQFAAWIGPRGSQPAARVIAQGSGIAAGP